MLSGTQILNSGFLNNLRISAVDSSNKYEEAVVVVRMFSCIHYSGLLYSFFFYRGADVSSASLRRENSAVKN